MTYLEIEAFLTIIKSGSISAAANQLYVTQPALSRRIQSLEQELGYPLFVRQKGVRSISLTEEGTAFIPVAEKWKQVCREALAIGSRNQKPVLNLASIGSISTYLLPDLFRQIISPDNFYNLCFHNYHSREAYDYVDNGLTDLAIISDDMYHKSVQTIPLFQEPFFLVGGPAWNSVEEIHPSCLDPSQEIRLPWSPEFDCWHDHWFGNSVYPRVQLDQMSLLEEFLTDQLYAIAPLHVAANLRQGKLHRVRLLEGPEDEIIYYLVRDRRKDPLIQHFLTLLKEKISTWEEMHLF